MQPMAMSDEAFYGYVHPLHNRRYYLALVFAVLLFPLIAVALLAGTIVLIVPAIGLLLWIGMRVFFANMLGNTILVSPENYPRIHAMTEEVKVRLGYTRPIYVFVYEEGTFNASMRHVFFRRAIFLNSQLLQSGVSDREVRWLIGRFVGYMRARKQAGVLGWVIRAAQRLLVFNVFILPYERAMVYTGDRLALAEIDGDLASAAAAMQKVLVGRELGYSINPEGIIAQHRQVKGSLFAFLARLGKGFPHTTARYVDMILFAKAFYPEQYAAFEASNPGLPADLGQLGISQQTATGAPVFVRAPWGWTCATATLAVLVAMGALTYVVVDNLAATPNSSQSSDVIVTPAVVDDEGLVATELAGAAPPLRVPPANTHYDEEGRLQPDEGCRWLNDAPDDFRVVCQ